MASSSSNRIRSRFRRDSRADSSLRRARSELRCSYSLRCSRIEPSKWASNRCSPRHRAGAESLTTASCRSGPSSPTIGALIRTELPAMPPATVRMIAVAESGSRPTEFPQTCVRSRNRLESRPRGGMPGVLSASEGAVDVSASAGALMPVILTPTGIKYKCHLSESFTGALNVIHPPGSVPSRCGILSNFSLLHLYWGYPRFIL